MLNRTKERSAVFFFDNPPLYVLMSSLCIFDELLLCSSLDAGDNH